MFQLKPSVFQTIGVETPLFPLPHAPAFPSGLNLLQINMIQSERMRHYKLVGSKLRSVGRMSTNTCQSKKSMFPPLLLCISKKFQKSLSFLHFERKSTSAHALPQPCMQLHHSHCTDSGFKVESKNCRVGWYHDRWNLGYNRKSLLANAKCLRQLSRSSHSTHVDDLYESWKSKN